LNGPQTAGMAMRRLNGSDVLTPQPREMVPRSCPNCFPEVPSTDQRYDGIKSIRRIEKSKLWEMASRSSQMWQGWRCGRGGRGGTGGVGFQLNRQ